MPDIDTIAATYTDEQLQSYVQNINEGDDPLEFLAFTKSLDQRAHTDLYNHWEYGQKVKMKKAADDLAQKGWDMVGEYMGQIKDAVRKDDDSTLREILSELSPNALELVLRNLDPAEVEIYLEYQICTIPTKD